MKKILVTFLAINLFSAAQNINGYDTAWVNSYGGPGIEIGRDVRETSDKGFIIGGTTSTFGSGNTSFYLVKTDSLGTHKWSKTLGSIHNDFCYSIEIDTDGGFFLIGYSNQDLTKGYDGYLIKTDSLGNFLWSKTYGGLDWDFIYNSCLMPDGGLLLCGETNSESQGGTDALLIRTNSKGDTLWTKKIGDSGDDSFYSVEQLNNRIYVVGKLYDVIDNKTKAALYKLDFNGNILSQDFFLGSNFDYSVYNDLSFSSNGEILLCGKHGTTTLGNHLLRRVDTTSFTLKYYHTSPQDYYVRSIVEGYNNDIYTMSAGVGGLGGTIALYMRWDADFNFQNGAPFGGSKDEEGYEITKTTKGYAFVGSTNSYGTQDGSIDHNVYLVIFNRQALQSEYFIILNEFQDNLSPVGIKQNVTEDNRLILYPNPVNSVYTIRFPNSNFNGKILKYELYDSKGSIVDESFMDVNQDRLILNRKDISSGIYYYKLSENNSIISKGKISFE